MTPDLVFRGPCLLDFLGLAEHLQLVAVSRRGSFQLDLLFHHRSLCRWVATELQGPDY